jgi:hypothetical protein
MFLRSGGAGKVIFDSSTHSPALIGLAANPIVCPYRMTGFPLGISDKATLWPMGTYSSKVMPLASKVPFCKPFGYGTTATLSVSAALISLFSTIAVM